MAFGEKGRHYPTIWSLFGSPVRVMVVQTLLKDKRIARRVWFQDIPISREWIRVR